MASELLDIYERVFANDPERGSVRAFAIDREMQKVVAAKSLVDAMVVVQWWHDPVTMDKNALRKRVAEVRRLARRVT